MGLLGKVRNYGLIGGGVSLGMMGFEVSKDLHHFQYPTLSSLYPLRADQDLTFQPFLLQCLGSATMDGEPLEVAMLIVFCCGNRNITKIRVSIPSHSCQWCCG